MVGCRLQPVSPLYISDRKLDEPRGRSGRCSAAGRYLTLIAHRACPCHYARCFCSLMNRKSVNTLHTVKLFWQSIGNFCHRNVTRIWQKNPVMFWWWRWCVILHKYYLSCLGLNGYRLDFFFLLTSGNSIEKLIVP